jgi:serine/threonine-protein kinase RsbW
MYDYAVTQLRPSYSATCRSRTFPASPDQVREARRFLAGVMGDQPATADAVLCLSELVSNAILHSDSRRPGGTFTVRAIMRMGRLRAEVEDGGGRWRPRLRRCCQHGRGLTIVGALAGAWDVIGSDRGPRGPSGSRWTADELGIRPQAAARRPVHRD